MPAGSEWKRSWWSKASKLEKILLGVLTIAAIIILILIILLLRKQSNPISVSETCSSTACLTEASKIAQYVNPDVDPCQEFYEFACGNFLKNAHGNEKLSMLSQLQEQNKWQLMEAYSEPIKSGDHKMVKVVKSLFAACMDKKGIQNDNLKTMKEALVAIGGWPVVEERRWNESNFDWLNATYKLREMGYFYKVFLELSVEPDPGNETQFIYKVATPYMWDYSSYNFDKIKFMIDVAVRFGARPYDRTLEESMRTAERLLTQLQMETHARFAATVHSKHTVEQYQKLYPGIDWLMFVNTLGGPHARISKSDLVLFPPPETLTNWINIILRTPKKVQANYMVWKVIEQTIPFLTTDLQNPNLKTLRDEAREEFCLREIQARFIPSPAEIVCDRRYLPMSKKQKVEELVDSIKSQLIKALEKVNWIEDGDKKKMVDKAKALEVVIGHPHDYFGDSILDELDVDMISAKSDFFLSLMAQATRNHQTMLYSQIRKPRRFYQKRYIVRAYSLPTYDGNDNILFVPSTATNDLLFNENRPQYLNYGLMGNAVAQLLTEVLIGNLKAHFVHQIPVWTNKTVAGATDKLKCIREGLKDQKWRFEEFISVIQTIQAAKLSHAAYEDWSKGNVEELALTQTKYNAKQTFWISLESSFCQPESPVMGRSPVSGQISSDVVSAALNHYSQLVGDFECPAGTNVNPSNCDML